MTVSVIIRSVTDDLLVDVPTSHMRVAREILALPFVEAASHTVLHPLNWRRQLTRRSLPRSVVWYPGLDNYRHSMVAEVGDSIRFIDERLLESGKRCRVLLWSGAANPREDAILESARRGAVNLNGGTYRWDAHTDSVGFVPPFGRRVGSAYQVYCGAANENNFDGFYSSMPGVFRHIDETLTRTGRDRILKPANVYVHFYSAERPARLAALRQLIDKWAHQAETVPVFASTYAQAVHSTQFRCSIQATQRGWRLRDFDHCRCLRLDDEARGVDWAHSDGIAGARRIGTSLFVQLAGPDAELALGGDGSARPHLEQSDHLLDDLALTTDGLRCRSVGHRPRQLMLAGLPPRGQLLVRIGDSRHLDHADRDGRYRVGVDHPAPVDVQVWVR